MEVEVEVKENQDGSLQKIAHAAALDVGMQSQLGDNGHNDEGRAVQAVSSAPVSNLPGQLPYW